MSWTTPKTSVVGDTISVSYWNTNNRDNLNFLYGNSFIKLLEVSSTGNTISFPSLNSYSTFTHLLIIGSLRSNNASNLDDLNIRVNSDTGGNYTYTSIRYDGAGTISQHSNLNATSMRQLYIPANNSSANTFAPVQFIIPYFNNTFGHKSIFATGSAKQAISATTDLFIHEGIGYWQSTNAITQLDFSLLASLANFVTGSYLSLYGIN